jgi:hypothetical protein
VFGRDMIFNVEHSANWEFIRQNKQKIIAKNNAAENAKRIPHDYSKGDQVMLKIGSENKYEQPYSGPHKILEVKTNGTVRLQMGAVTDTVNIRRLDPYSTTSGPNLGGECSMRQSHKRRRTNKAPSSKSKKKGTEIVPSSKSKKRKD